MSYRYQLKLPLPNCILMDDIERADAAVDPILIRDWYSRAIELPPAAIHRYAGDLTKPDTPG